MSQFINKTNLVVVFLDAIDLNTTNAAEKNNMNSAERLKQYKNEIVSKYAVRKNSVAIFQTLNTLVPYLLLFYLTIMSLSISLWLAAALCFVLVLFALRVFVILHDCGHGCLYKNPAENKVVGFIMGVMCGMPQYVWSKHHDYHHSTNGNWQKYQGPLSVMSVDRFSQLSDKAKKSYANNRNILLAPMGGFLYFIFNPRITWLKGSLQLLLHLISGKTKNRKKPFSDLANEFETRYWNTWKEYWHMTANNVCHLTLVILACYYFGVVEFLSIYVIVLSFAGGLGIILFTVQHNFEGSYATGNDDWDYFKAALEGTSFLEFPKILNWFSADIAYHHIHHLSSRIPNYNLETCHKEFQHLFGDVKRIRLKDIPYAFKFILWDNHTNEIISVEQFEARYGAVSEVGVASVSADHT